MRLVLLSMLMAHATVAHATVAHATGAQANVCSNVRDCYTSFAEQEKMMQDSGELFGKKDIDRCLSEKSAINDKANGYLRFECDLLTHGVEAAIFQGQKNKYLVITDEGVSVCNSYAFRIEGKRLVNVSDSVLPSFSKSFLLKKYQQRFSFKKFTADTFQRAFSEACLKLPRHGTTINVVSHWDNKQFYDRMIFQLYWDRKLETFQLTEN